MRPASPPSIRRRCGALLAALLAGAPAAAHAEAPSPAKGAVLEAERRQRAGDPAGALAQLRAAEASCRDERCRALVAIGMGGLAEAAGDRPRALELYGRAAEVLHAAGERSWEGKAQLGLGVVRRALGEKAAAQERFDRALALYRAAGNRGGEAQALFHLGTVRQDLGQRRAALQHFEQALALFRGEGQREGVAKALLAIGRTRRQLGDKAGALQRFDQALPIFRAGDNRLGEAATLYAMGGTLGDLGRDREALARLSEALPLYRALSERDGEAAVLNNLGKIHRQLGDPRAALARHAEARAILAATGGGRGAEATTLHNMAAALADLGEVDRAVEDLVEALPLFRSVGYRDGEARALAALSRLLAAGAPERAIFHGKQAVNVYQSLRADIDGLDRETQQGYAAAVAGAYRHLAGLLAEAGRLGEAEQVLGLLKDQEFFGLVRGPEHARPGAPLGLAGAEREAGARYEEAVASLTRLSADWTALRRQAARTPQQEARLAALGAELEAANARFRATVAGLGAALGRAGAGSRGPDARLLRSTFQGALERLGPGTVAVLTLVGEDDLRTILVTHQAARSFAPPRPVPARALRRLVLEFREALRDPAADPRPAAARLYDVLVRPMEADLAGADTVLWWLDDDLRYVPMAALHDGQRWLGERLAGVVVTGSDLANLAAPPRPTWDALAFAATRPHQYDDPASGASHLLPGLRGAGREVAAIVGDGAGAGVLRGAAFLDDRFSREALLGAAAGRPAVIHVASHFVFAADEGEDLEARSFLLLGDGGHLSLEELASAPRVLEGVDLLVLSACDTAVGGAHGAEVDGLGRTMQEKGAPAVLATLWPVDDDSTPALMRRFYELKQGQGLAKAEALRRAQRELASGAVVPGAPGSGAAAPGSPGRGLARSTTPGAAWPGWTHPRYWAPFVILGNGL